MNKRKNGFTLIELLAVIVILAIIALVATPIVLNIINDAKEQAGLRSAEFYLDALEMSIAKSVLEAETVNDGVYDIKDGSLCLDNTCTEKLEVEVNGEVPNIGSIYIKNSQIEDISLVLNNKTIIKNNDGEISYINKLEDICTHDNTNGVAAKTAGAKYECRVKAGTKYTFYVLTTPTNDDTHVNLIMDQNINSDGTPAGIEAIYKDGDKVYNIVAWLNQEDYLNAGGSPEDWTANIRNIAGPITAMKFLYKATKSWINVPVLNYEYKDREYHGILDSNTKIGYTSFISSDGVVVITPLSGNTTTIGTPKEPLRARMPIYSGVWNDDWSAKETQKGELSDKKDDDSNSYLSDNTKVDMEDCFGGYWSLSTFSQTAGDPWGMSCDGNLYSEPVNTDYVLGVRPVINLKI